MKMKYGRKNPKRVLRNILITTISVVILVPVLTVGGYVTYAMASYYRIGDIELEVNKQATLDVVKSNEELTVTTYNIGFGAYSDDYTFFMDSGYDENGNVVSGEYGKARSKEEVLKNVNGSAETLKKLDSDFNLVQEVDLESHRAYFVNQKEILDKTFVTSDSTYALNYDSPYLFYPFHDPHGQTKAGLATYSKYKIQEAHRKEYVVTEGFGKYMDLDRCFSVHRFKTDNDKDFVLINSHMSAYDEGGVVRNAQLEQLNSFMLAEANKGNYVVCGGDFNHDLLTNNPEFPSYTTENVAYSDQIKQLKPDWLSMMFDETGKTDFDKEFKVYASDNEPSCRDADVIYEKGYTYVSTIDGFICSSNVEVKNVYTTRTGEDGFIYSDHQPSTMTFVLK